MRTRDARASFEDFVLARSGSLLRTALLLTGQNRAEAEDLLQLALERAYRHWARVHATEEPERYVRRILANASADRWRRLARRPEQPLPPGDAGLSTADMSAEVAERDFLLRALAQLPPRQRAVLVLRYYDDLSAPYGLRGTLWDPTSRRVIRTFRQIDAVSPEQVAWGGSCDGCQVHVFDARTGSVTSIEIPRGTRIDASGVYKGGDIPSVGAFSSDGRLIAVGLASGTDRHRISQAERLGMIDLVTRRLLIVPGIDLTGTAAQSLFYGWQSSTRRLVMALDACGVGLQVGYWQPGAAHLRLTTAQIPQGTTFIYVQ